MPKTADSFLNDFQTEGLKRLENPKTHTDFHDFSGKQKKEISVYEAGMLKLFCWNICNPSVERAEKQAQWLIKQQFDVFCLTETKDSAGCNFLARYFRARGFFVDFPKPEGKEYGAMIISRLPFNAGLLKFNSARINSIRLLVQGLELVNTYVPNNRENGKRDFLRGLSDSLKGAPKTAFIFCGDLNVIEPDHVPHYSKFESWEYGFYETLSGQELQLRDAFRALNPDAKEYSWVGRTGDGYRYDHCFVSEDLVLRIRECLYLHEPRLNRLSDHSGLAVTLRIQ